MRSILILLSALVLATGCFWAFQRGAPDFSVFHEAWRLVTVGRGTEIFRATPDRFLYAPGFAWILSPLGLIPRGAALLLWTACKLAVVIGVARAAASRVAPGRAAGTLAAAGILIVARPLLIDFSYGQVNALILGACLWAVLTHFETDELSPRARGLNGLSWFVLALAAVAKIFPGPLLLLPWVSTRGVPRERLFREKCASAFAVLLILLLPMISVGWTGWIDLMLQWKAALVSKGLPLESHNQSFAALLHHYFGGNDTPVIALGGKLLPLGMNLMSENAIASLAAAWTLITTGLLLAWILRTPGKRAIVWGAVAIGLLILPSHLVWKPYFVMSLPLAVIAAGEFRYRPWVAVSAFVAINLTGFDFIGGSAAARIEAASLFLWIHLLLIWSAIRSEQVLQAK